LTLPTTTAARDFTEAAGLLRYDPAAISRIYGRPSQAAVPAGLADPGADRSVLLGVGFDRSAAGWPTRSVASPGRGNALELLASLGPAFIRAGQASPHVPTSCRRCCSMSSPACKTSCRGFDSELAMPASKGSLGHGG